MTEIIGRLGLGSRARGWAVVCLFLALAAPAWAQRSGFKLVPKHGRFERELSSGKNYANPAADVKVGVVFTAPSGQNHTVYAFWDGGNAWRVRFSPDEYGTWLYATVCSDAKNLGLDNQKGIFTCTASTGKTRFDQHGPVRISPDGYSLAHADGTPFFWMGDTAWNGPLLSSRADWELYLKERTRQNFTAVQWVTTQWRASPSGDASRQVAFTGQEQIRINPAFFQRLDEKIEAMNRSGLLSVPVLLWAIGGGAQPAVNPGFSLPEDQAILLARYMVARWGAYNVAWILAGDGDYRGENAEKWKRIGKAVFAEEPHAPVIMHPGGMQWILDGFNSEKWLSISGYQSGHGDDDNTLAWLTQGPPSKDWKKAPRRPFINLEPPYENHLAYQSKTPISPATVRRAVYWSLLNAPTAGVTYGGHGVWGWDDGTKPPTDHAGTGVPLPWKEALRMPGAEEMAVVSKTFAGLNFPKLRPAPELLANQPGATAAKKFISASRSESGEDFVFYTPEETQVNVLAKLLPQKFTPAWVDPRTGARIEKAPVRKDAVFEFTAPSEGDWLLLIKKVD